MSPAYLQRIERFRYARCVLTGSKAERAADMRRRGMTYPAIARWFSCNGTPVSWQAVKNACDRYQREVA